MDDWQIFNSKALMESGDLRPIYQSKAKTLPEILSEEAFTVALEHKSEANTHDMKLRRGMDWVLAKLGDVSNTYFIVDIGHAHLPGNGVMLMEHGIDSYFAIPDHIHDRFHETIKYWSPKFQKAKDALKQPKGLATLIDCHRSDYSRQYALSSNHFPSAETLKRAGITKVVYMNESGVGRIQGMPQVKDLVGIFKQYADNGLALSAFGIDYRAGFRNQ